MEVQAGRLAAGASVRFCKIHREAPDEVGDAITTAPPFVEVALVPPDRAADKCILGESECGALQESAVMLLGGLKDALTLLEAKVSKATEEHETAMRELNLQMDMILASKTEFNTQLAGATSKMNAIEQELHLSNSEHEELSHELHRQQEECTRGVREIVTSEMCRMRSLRGALVGQGSQLSVSDLVDCEVSDWLPGECSVSCDDSCPHSNNGKPCGGIEKMTREVIQQPNEYGFPCPPLEQVVTCNQVQCPMDCVLSMWSGWSACSRQCGAGVRQRTRSVLQQPRNGGMACDTTTETEPCNTASCSRGCVLSHWGPWEPCTAACGGGYQERHRPVLLEPTVGGAACPSPWSHSRHGVRMCNTHPCSGDEQCLAKQDLLLAVDTRQSLGGGGSSLDDVRTFAQALVAGYDTATISSYLAVDGDPGNSKYGHEQTICAQADSVAAAMRCCKTVGSGNPQCVSLCDESPPNPGNTAERKKLARELLYNTHHENSLQCAARGMRLCTEAELKARVCANKGCWMDQLLVWTSDSCGDSGGPQRWDKPRVGVLQYGNGELLQDGSVSAAQEVLAFDEDLEKAQEALSGLQSRPGFSNLAQAFALAEKMFSLEGRRDVAPVLMVITDQRPPFRLQTLEKAHELWSAGIRIVVVCLARFAGGEDVQALQALASAPAQANFLHVPGVLMRQTTPSYFAADGAPGITDGGHQETICAPATSKAAAIRCCNSAGTTCRSICTSEPNSQQEALQLYTAQSDAEEQCAAQGLRLCMLDELNQDVCKGKGCFLDQMLVWTSEPCNVQTDLGTYAHQVLAAACPRTESPTMRLAQEQEQGFKLLYEGEACPSTQANQQLLGKYVASPANCSELAQAAGFDFFSVGTDLRHGECHGEQQPDCEPGDLERSYSDLYKHIATR